MKKYSALLLILISTLFISCKKNPDSSYKYIMDLPQKCQGAPVIFMLHGYGSSAENFKTDTSFEKEANKRGYAVVYVTSTKAGWSSGAGEDSFNDVNGLCYLAKSIQKEFKFDKKRMYAAGFSNGGFMTHRLIAEGKGTFAAGICVGGDMSRNVWKKNQTKKIKTSFFQITGEKDNAVPKKSDGSAESSFDPAIEDVLEHYINSSGRNHFRTEETTIGNGSMLTRYYAQTGKNQVWHLFVKDGRHAWPSVQYNNIDINNLILDFLDDLR